MRHLLLAVVAVGAAVATASSASAEGGCGPAFHRGPYGGCRPNGGPVFVGPGVVEGVFYPGRGYYSGGRYWGRRYHYHGGWRYR